ncbi:hypothetical protein N8222_06180 [Oceanospirillaceae bacterium]|nr:hypothetical protein [Oceanospirillaceae bacterium]
MDQEKQLEQLGAIVMLADKAMLASMDDLRNYLDATFFNNFELDNQTKDELFDTAEAMFENSLLTCDQV